MFHFIDKEEHVAIDWVATALYVQLELPGGYEICGIWNGVEYGMRYGTNSV